MNLKRKRTCREQQNSEVTSLARTGTRLDVGASRVALICESHGNDLCLRNYRNAHISMKIRVKEAITRTRLSSIRVEVDADVTRAIEWDSGERDVFSGDRA